jgi:ADP-ribose pyrophosphatase YjhB (NUDIX family)
MESRGCQVHKLVADVCILADNNVLLVRYKDVSGYDGEKGWFLPDDYLHHAEHPQDAAHRILREQANVEVPALSLGSVESFEGHAYWHLVFHYYIQLNAIPQTTSGPNVSFLEWFALGTLPPPEQVGHGGWALETLQTLMSKM